MKRREGERQRRDGETETERQGRNGDKSKYETGNRGHGERGKGERDKDETERVRKGRGRAMNLQHTIKAIVRKGETHYVAECVEIPVVTQGRGRIWRNWVSPRREEERE